MTALLQGDICRGCCWMTAQLHRLWCYSSSTRIAAMHRHLNTYAKLLINEKHRHQPILFHRAIAALQGTAVSAYCVCTAGRTGIQRSFSNLPPVHLGSDVVAGAFSPACIPFPLPVYCVDSSLKRLLGVIDGDECLFKRITIMNKSYHIITIITTPKNHSN